MPAADEELTALHEAEDRLCADTRDRWGAGAIVLWKVSWLSSGRPQ